MKPTPKIIAILAGGRARRYNGQDKGEILIEGRRLIDIIAERLSGQSDDIVMSGRHDYGLNLKFISDAKTAPRGPVGGIYSVWSSLRDQQIEGFFTVAIDGPNIPLDLMERLYSASSSTIATDAIGRHPTYGWWRMTDLSTIFTEIDASASISLNTLSDMANAQVVKWGGHKNFLNINSPKDLLKM